MQRKLATRLILGLFGIAVLVGVYNWFQEWSKDIDLPATVNSAGWIAAIELRDQGAVAVVFDAAGKKKECPNSKVDSQDRDVVWRPDGNRIFFASDRESRTFDIYRWNPASDKVTRRTIGSSTKGSPSFGLPGDKGANDMALITQGGNINELDPRTGESRQVLPPVRAERGDVSQGEGAGGQFELMYQRLGVAFKKARWGKNRESIIAVIAREDGEVLMVQGLVPVNGDEGLSLPAPVPIIAADHIEFDVSASGAVVAVAQGFQFVDRENVPKEFIKDGVAKEPYRHAMIMFDPSNPAPEGIAPLFVSNNDEQVIGGPKCSPDSSAVACVAGIYGEGGRFEPKQLVVMPMRGMAAELASPVVSGAIRDVGWHPNGNQLVYVKTEGGRRAIFTVRKDGTGEKRVSDAKLDYLMPQFSPQTKG